VPASLPRAQYKRYERSPAKTEFVKFEGRPHLGMAAEGWQEIAESIDGWLDGVLEAVPGCEGRIGLTECVERNVARASLELRPHASSRVASRAWPS
jgi:hypothetical protein